LKHQFSLFLCFLIFLLSFNSLISVKAQNSDFPTHDQLKKATNYLISHFNDTVNLIYESEDTGRHFLLDEYPELEGYLFYNNTYWIYSDNLFAYLGLEPFSPYHSKLIKESYEEKVLSLSGFSNLFEVVKGQPIKEQILDAKNYYHGNFSGCYIFARKHDQEPPLRIEDYADLCLYKALSLYFDKEYEGAEEWFFKAYEMFDGKGLYDKATQVDGKYANYKMALLLYTSKVLDIDIPAFDTIERQLWSMQNTTNGGIVSLADLDGNPIGSSNCETTSLTLMVYNDNLINRLNPKTKLSGHHSNPDFQLWVIAGAIVIFIGFVLYIAYQLSERWF